MQLTSLTVHLRKVLGIRVEKERRMCDTQEFAPKKEVHRTRAMLLVEAISMIIQATALH